MPEKNISEKTIKEIDKLYQIQKVIGAVNIREISEIVGVTYSIAFFYTKSVEQGYTTRYEYNEDKIRKKGFKSGDDYREQLAKDQGFDSYNELIKHKRRERGFETDKEYTDEMAKKSGFESNKEYMKVKSEERKQRPENKKMAEIITTILDSSQITSRELAHRVGIRENLIAQYKSGIILPKKDAQERIFNVFNLPYKTIDDAL